ncbi:helix-turn-helix protein [Microbacteriaceae bacterium MWH-Ta3]|nr:helix-turn-helix protein [Microbacteriaceae bacterium MWH-Ta3]
MKAMSDFDEFDTPLDRRARILVRNDANFLAELVAARKRQGISQGAVAERMGVSQPAVAAFERAENDPKLSTIRRYAMAVGLLVVHLVEEDHGEPIRVGHRFATSTDIVTN